MSPELEKVFEESENPLEIFFAVFLYAIIEMIFKIMDVMVVYEES